MSKKSSLQVVPGAQSMTGAQSGESVFSLTPRNLAEAMQYAELIQHANLTPKDYKGRPGDIILAMDMGGRIGMGPFQAMQSIAVINGRATLWGDGSLAICQRHPAWGGHEESYDAKAMEARCVVHRKGDAKPAVVTFSAADAKTARLWGKQGPWTTHPKRMLQLRARGFALRDKFPDALMGMLPAEEVMDYPKDAQTGERATLPDNWVDAEDAGATLDEVLEVIEAANDLDALALAKPLVRQLSAADRVEAVAAGQRRRAELTRPLESGSFALGSEPEPEDKLLPADVMRQAIAAAKTPQELHEAVEGYQNLDDHGERESVYGLYRTKKAEFEAEEAFTDDIRQGAARAEQRETVADVE